MLGYIALFIFGLLFLVGLVRTCRLLIQMLKDKHSDDDPLLDELEAKAAEQNFKSAKTLGFLLYSIIFFSLLWYMFYYEPKPSYQVSSVELYNEFKEDKVKAIAKYRNEYIAVSGIYVGNELVFGSPAILLQTPSELEKVQCNFEGRRSEQTSLLSLGQEVNLRGRVLGKTGNVIIEKCSVSKKSQK